MNNLTQKIKILNELYISFRKNYIKFKKLFSKQSAIYQKILLSEKILYEAYMLIKDSLESEEINKQFIAIIRGIHNENKKRNR